MKAANHDVRRTGSRRTKPLRIIYRSVEDLTLDPGLHDLIYKFPFLPLCPRSYNWQLSLWVEKENVDLWEAIPELQVTSPNYQHALDEWNGFLNLPSEFRIFTEKG